MQNKIFLPAVRVDKLLHVSPTAVKTYLHILYFSTGIIPLYGTSVELLSSLLSLNTVDVTDSISQLYGAGLIEVKKNEDVLSIIVNTFDDDLIALSQKRQFLYVVRGQVWRLPKIKEPAGKSDIRWNEYITKLQLLFPKT